MTNLQKELDILHTKEYMNMKEIIKDKHSKSIQRAHKGVFVFLKIQVVGGIWTVAGVST